MSVTERASWQIMSSFISNDDSKVECPVKQSSAALGCVTGREASRVGFVCTGLPAFYRALEAALQTSQNLLHREAFYAEL